MADGGPRARVERFRGFAAVALESGPLRAVVVPEAGMLGASVSWSGQEFVDLHGGPEAYRRGHTTGIPLLHPWANRLAERRYRAAGATVDLEGLSLHTDADGLPMHGTMAGRAEWTIDELGPTGDGATLRAAYDFGADPAQLASFPFPHRLELTYAVRDSVAVTTRVSPTTDVAVPVSFGWHPYLRLPRARRSSIRLGLPARRHLLLDERGIPTGTSHLEPAEQEPLGQRSFDDHYELDADRRLSIEGGGHRVEVQFDERYPFSQVYSPQDGRFVCLEPMTATTNALISGDHPVVQPGESFEATFSVSIRPT